MPFVSQAQRGYLHSHPEILGKAGLKEWDEATKGKKLPKRVPKKGGSTTLAANSMKYVSLKGRESNLHNKKAFASGDCDARENS